MCRASRGPLQLFGQLEPPGFQVRQLGLQTVERLYVRSNSHVVTLIMLSDTGVDLVNLLGDLGKPAFDRCQLLDCGALRRDFLLACRPAGA
jgi:hypothetical protein